LDGLSPPDPILPYFPFYYRKPPHQTDASLATNSLPTLMMAAISNILAFAFLHLVFGCWSEWRINLYVILSPSVLINL
jgi:hypothetical protein